MQTDRINVGGNESGQQSVFVAPGAATAETTWAVDGVNITDVAARSSPAYFDFDAFEEVQFTTGGSDVTLEGAGVTVNIVTKRGTNEWRGSARYNLTDGEWQSDAEPDLGGTQASFLPNEIGEVKEYGLELGGPILKDRLWIWGAYGTSDPIDNIVGATGQHDITVLENTNGKLNAQIVASNSLNVQYNENDKLKDGRGAGATRAPETTTNQSGVGGKPNDTLKIEDTQVLNSNFYLTGLYSFVDGGFQLVPKGGVATPMFQLDDGVYRGSYYFLYNNRDVTQYKLDGSTFFNTGSTAHELKFGASHRLAETASVFGYAGEFWVYTCGVFGCDGDEVGPNTKGLNIYRDSDSNDESTFEAIWLQDTLTFGNLTMNAGLRYETATGEVLPASIEGVIQGWQNVPARAHHERHRSRHRVRDHHPAFRRDLRHGRGAQDPPARQPVALRQPVPHRQLHAAFFDRRQRAACELPVQRRQQQQPSSTTARPERSRFPAAYRSTSTRPIRTARRPRTSPIRTWITP